MHHVLLHAYQMTEFAINLDESFETLPIAPIVEAVIYIQISFDEPIIENSLMNAMSGKFGTGYHFAGSQREIQFQATVTPPQPPNQTFRDLGWKGLRFHSSDKKYIVQFNRDGFALSRLEPYENWEKFSDEALRLWNGYAEFTKPTQITRLGLRYINRIQLPPNESRFQEYVNVGSSTPESLSFIVSGFMHQDAVIVPNYSYAINIIKTLQQPANLSLGLNLILDIDTFSTVSLTVHRSQIKNHLAEIRWLKNKVFFDTVTEKSLERFR